MCTQKRKFPIDMFKYDKFLAEKLMINLIIKLVR